MSILTIKGTLDFDPKDFTKKHQKQSSWKKVLIANIDGEICEYYSWFLKKRFNLILNHPLRKAHLTIVNDRANEIKDWDRIKKKYQGKQINILYDTDLRSNGEYWWMRADSIEARSIRRKLGLDPDPYFNYHITIGFPNEKNIEHSRYILKTIMFHNQYDKTVRGELFKEHIK